MKAVVLGLICRGDRWLLQRRDPGNAVLPGLWELPGGKVEPGEALEQALGRELQEELGLSLRSARPGSIIEGLPRMHLFFAEVDGFPRTELAWGWFTPEEMFRLPMPPRNHELSGMLVAEPRRPRSHLIV